jgi:predicted nucleic acid-binding protein
MTLYVLDASAWIRFFLGDGPAIPELEKGAQFVERNSAAFIAPELILIETAHALTRKVRLNLISRKEQQELWQDMQRMPIELFAACQHVETAIELALTHNLSVYDALYLALAIHAGARLITADVQLAEVACILGV